MSSNIREASPPERGHEDDAQLNNQDELKRPCPQAYKVFREIDYHPELCSNCSEKRSEWGAHTGEQRHYYRKTGPNGVSEDRFYDGCGTGKHHRIWHAELSLATPRSSQNDATHSTSTSFSSVSKFGRIRRTGHSSMDSSRCLGFGAPSILGNSRHPQHCVKRSNGSIWQSGVSCSTSDHASLD